MSHLTFRLFGSFEASQNNIPVSFTSQKSRALLAYLAVEADRPHRRDTLATLLWPDHPEQAARNNLRYTLSALRKALKDRRADRQGNGIPPILIVTRDTVQFNCDSDCWLDVQAYLTDKHPQRLSKSDLEGIIALYRGHFLEGFSIKDSAEFDDWLLLTRDRLLRYMISALNELMRINETEGQLSKACTYAWQWVELEPLQESAYQQLIRLLALTGQRTTALEQYDVCSAMLKREFGIEPTKLLRELHQQILHEDMSRTPRAIIAKTSLSQEVTPHIVSRYNQQSQLIKHLDWAIRGQGRVVSIRGEAGQGKSVLMHSFAQLAQKTYGALCICMGRCNAYTGIGEPYLPFREILTQMLGEVPDNIDTGLSQATSHKLAATTIRALLDYGPDLFDIFIPHTVIFNQRNALNSTSPWQQLKDEVQAHIAQNHGQTPQQEELFSQYIAVLTHVAKEIPLLLLIDDLQWMDLGSISLLFHLGRKLSNHRILVIGAYRSEEVTIGRQGERHPLIPLLSEFKRYWKNNEIDLDKADGRRFVQAYLDNMPHSLNSDFRDTLYERTLGHPLFTVELVRGMQERGNLIQDERGYWQQQPALEWDILPARIETVIAERFDRLPQSQQQCLRIASILGEFFLANVIAQVQGVDEQTIISTLSGDLSRKHRLVHASGIEAINNQQLLHYRFRHILFQVYIYNSMDTAERSYLHQQVARALLDLYQDQHHAVAATIGWHYEQAGMLSDAVTHYQQAGDNAIRMSANEEALIHYYKALELLLKLPPSQERDERELALQFNIATPIIALKSWAAPEALQAYERARQISEKLGRIPDLLRTLMIQQYAYTTAIPQHDKAVKVAEKYFQIAKSLDSPMEPFLGHSELAVTTMFTGDFKRSHFHCQKTFELYDRDQHHPLVYTMGHDPGVITYGPDLYNLWYLGYPDQALKQSEYALALAQEIGPQFSMLFIMHFKSRLHRWRYEPHAVDTLSDGLMRFWEELKMGMAEAGALQDSAWVLSENGEPQKAIPIYEEGLEKWHATGMKNHTSEFLGVLAEIYGKAGNPQRGLEVIAEALEFAHKSHEFYHLAELYRLRGLLILQQDTTQTQQAEADFRKAIQVAKDQEARMCELRNATCLAELLQQAGDADQAYAVLSPIYNWFTEGFDLRDLQEAKALLDELASITKQSPREDVILT